jgi:hypothetical protein
VLRGCSTKTVQCVNSKSKGQKHFLMHEKHRMQKP